MPHINIWAVLVAAVASFLVGWLWHSPLLFGKIWGKLMGLDKLSKKQQTEMMKKMGSSMLFGFLANVVIAYVLSYMVQACGAFFHTAGVMSGLQTGFWIWLGFMATLSLNSVLWEGRKLQLYFINVGYQLVTILVMGSILAIWP